MSDDAVLRDLLRQAGRPDDLVALDALLSGVDAAPTGADPDAWLELVGPDLPSPLAEALRGRRERLRQGDKGRGRSPW